MKKLLILSVLLLTSCGFLPTKPEWPKAPVALTEPCPSLKLVKEDTTKLSEVLNVVVDNYSLYHECQAKINAWNEWYNSQKAIYEDVK